MENRTEVLCRTDPMRKSLDPETTETISFFQALFIVNSSDSQEMDVVTGLNLPKTRLQRNISGTRWSFIALRQ